MQCTLLGYRDVSFTNRSTGELVEGRKFYVEDDGPEGMVGKETFDFFLSKARMAEVGVSVSPEHIGTEFDLSFNRYGKVDGLKSAYDR